MAYLFTGIVYGVGVSALQIVLLQVVSVREPRDPGAYGWLLSAQALGATVVGLFVSKVPRHRLGLVYLIGNLDEAVLVISLFASKGLELTAAVLLSSADYSRPLRRLASSPTFGGD